MLSYGFIPVLKAFNVLNMFVGPPKGFAISKKLPCTRPRVPSSFTLIPTDAKVGFIIFSLISFCNLFLTPVNPSSSNASFRLLRYLKTAVNAASISFLIAPIIAIFNYLVVNRYLDKKFVPPKWLNYLSIIGVLYLYLFSILYLFKKNLFL